MPPPLAGLLAGGGACRSVAYGVECKCMKFAVSIYRDEEGMDIAEGPAIPDCVSQGRTEAEVEANIAGAIRECLAVREELGMPLTVPRREVEVAV